MDEPLGARAQRRAAVNAALLAAGRRELARVGAAGLSLRAVARELGLAPSALFRYVANRDELLTLLIIDSYNALGQFVEEAESQVPRPDRRGRWRAICQAFRAWGHAHPNEYALLYGSPVPQYHAPAELTGEAGTRVTKLLMSLADGPVDEIPGLTLPDPEKLAALAAAAEAAELGDETLTHGLLSWTLLVGATSSEVFQQVGSEIAQLDTLFESAVALGELLLFGQKG